MVLTNLIKELLPLLTIIGDFILVFLLYLIITKKEGSFLKNRHLLFAFIVALIATLGSLFYSEILGYAPCKLCWYQRILMYPQVLLLGIALFKKDYGIRKYIIPMSILGAIFSAYHYLTQIFPAPSICSSGATCAAQVSFSYGYISIPIMALTAFLLIISFMILSNERRIDGK